MTLLTQKSRVARAIANLSSIGRTPIAVLTNDPEIEVVDIAGTVAGALGYAVNHIDGNDFDAVDFANDCDDLIANLLSRTAPPIIIVDLSDCQMISEDPNVAEVIKGITTIISTKVDGRTPWGLVVVTTDDQHDVARMIGDLLGRHDWTSYIPL